MLSRYSVCRHDQVHCECFQSRDRAGKLAMNDAVKLLDQTLAEEKKTDDTLTKLADTAVNAEAA
jgi:ferritin-like metal-binding protein YciE